MPQNRQISPVEEVQNPIVDVPFPDSELVNAIPEQVRHRPSQFVAERGEALNGGHASFVLSPIHLSKLTEPIKDRHLSCGLPVEDYKGARHLPLQGITIL
jgi:hypothetical protein